MIYLNYHGKLTTYFETGMEHLGLGLQLQESKFKTKNDRYDGTHKNGPEFYESLEGLILLRPGDRVDISTPQGLQTFLIGNRTLAQQDGYRLGGAYPKETIDLPTFVNFFQTELSATIIRPVKKVALYGGTFDPIHLGHKEIINQLHYQFDVVYVLPTNNWTKSKFTFSLPERIAALNAVSQNYINVQVLDWSLKEDTTSTYQMFNKLKKNLGIDPVIVIGTDNLLNIKQWKNYSQLKKLPFLIFQRGEMPTQVPLNNYQMVNFNKSYSGTEIRQKRLIDLIPPEARPHLDLRKIGEKN